MECLYHNESTYWPVFFTAKSNNLNSKCFRYIPFTLDNLKKKKSTHNVLIDYFQALGNREPRTAVTKRKGINAVSLFIVPAYFLERFHSVA